MSHIHNVPGQKPSHMVVWLPEPHSLQPLGHPALRPSGYHLPFNRHRRVLAGFTLCAVDSAACTRDVTCVWFLAGLLAWAPTLAPLSSVPLCTCSTISVPTVLLAWFPV